jgi:hypothetical protein
MGERVVLPEASEEPLLSQQALANLESARAAAENARAAAEKARDEMQETKPTIKPGNREIQIPERPVEFTANRIDARVETRGVSVPSPTEFPQPLPEARASRRRFRFLPFLSGIIGVIAISSGTYLYLQGQELWQAARSSLDTVEKAPAKISIAPQPAIVAAAARVAVTQDAPAREIVDRVSSHAMAPVRELPAPQPKLLVEPRIMNATLRTGPGLQFKPVGHADPKLRYEVTEWDKSWFKVIVPSGDKTNGSETSAWIRNDLVRLISR